MSRRRHVFISHHFADDKSVTGLTQLFAKHNWDIRNSSIRLKQANQARMERGEVSDATLKRVLRMKISWAQSVVVVIGAKTHSRPWVNYEIAEANRQGKRIIGVYERGGQSFEVPELLEKYGTSIVAWNAESILSALDGKVSFENPDGSSRSAVNQQTRTTC